MDLVALALTLALFGAPSAPRLATVSPRSSARAPAVVAPSPRAPLPSGVVDRIEGGLAVLELGKTIARVRAGPELREGDVVVAGRVDGARTAERRRAVERLLRRLAAEPRGRFLAPPRSRVLGSRRPPHPRFTR